jgi:hypothetical protein
LLRKADGADVDFLREGVRVLPQALMDADVTAQISKRLRPIPVYALTELVRYLL